MRVRVSPGPPSYAPLAERFTQQPQKLWPSGVWVQNPASPPSEYRRGRTPGRGGFLRDGTQALSLGNWRSANSPHLASSSASSPESERLVESPPEQRKSRERGSYPIIDPTTAY